MAFSHKKYSILALVCVLGFMAVVAGVNYVVDPYGRFGVNRLGLYILSAEPYAKMGLAKKRGDKVDLILLGDSRSTFIDVDDIEVPSAINCAKGGAQPQEIYSFLERYVPEGQNVIIGFKLGANGGKLKEGSDLFEKDESVAETLSSFLLSLKSFEHSLTTVARYVRGKPSRLKGNGSVNPPKWISQVDREDSVEREYQVWSLTGEYLNREGYSPEQMEYFYKIKDLLERKEIKAGLLVYPMHEDLLVNLRGTKEFAETAKWVKHLKEIFPEVVDLSDSRYSKRDCYLNLDLIHFTPAAGAELVNKEVLPRMAL